MSEPKRPGRAPYPPEVRERAVRMVFEHQGEYPSQWKAIESIPAKLSINHETLRQWVRRAETDAGERPGLNTDERGRDLVVGRLDRVSFGPALQDEGGRAAMQPNRLLVLASGMGSRLRSK